METLACPRRQLRPLPLPLLRKTTAVLICAALASACGDHGPTEPGPGTNLNPGGGGGGNIRWVNDDGTLAFPPGPGSSCSRPGYRTIQEAVNAANPGDRIYVCQGTYPEQVKIVGSGKDNILLKSVQLWKAVIKAPPALVPDAGDARVSIVRISAAHNVTILGFTISGPGPTPCSLHYGVRVDNSGSAKILGNRISHIRGEPFATCGSGAAVIIGRQTAASGQVLGNVFEDYQKNGPTVQNAGSSAEISYNRVFGRGDNIFEPQNGIQVSDGATATLRHNFVAKNLYTGGPDATGAQPAGTGILLFAPGQVVSERNTVPSNDYGVYAFQTAAGSSQKDSRVRSSTYDGIAVDATNGNQLTHNASETNTGPGVGLYNDAQSNTLVRNRINNNENSGILLDFASNNSVSANHIHRNGTDTPDDFTDGIRINTGSGNNLYDNKLKRNVTHDCHDNSYPLNTWTNNREGSSYPPGSALCGDDDEDELEPDGNYGCDPNYPWYADYSEAVDLEFSVGYSEFDLDSLLQLLPSINIVVVRPVPIPDK